jgi:hypothetical protein
VGYLERARLPKAEAIRRYGRKRTALSFLQISSGRQFFISCSESLAQRTGAWRRVYLLRPRRTYQHPVSEFFRALALVQLGELDHSMDPIVRYLREMTRFAQTPVGALIYPTLAQAPIAAGRTNGAIQAVVHGIAILEQNQARFASPNCTG